MSTKMIGLDLGQREVRAWQIEAGFSKYESRAAFHMPIQRDDDEELIDAQLRAAIALLEREDLERDSYALAIPRSLTSVLRHTLPAAQIKMIDEILPGELEDLLPFDYEDLFYDYQIVSQDENELDLLIVYTLRDEFDEFMERCQRTGLDPKVITLGGLYVHDWLREHLASTPSSSPLSEPRFEIDALEPDTAPVEPLKVLLDVGERGAEWLIFQGERLCHIQRADVGGGAITTALAETFKVDEGSAEEGKLSEARWVNPDALRLIEDSHLNKLSTAMNTVIEESLRPLFSEVSRSFLYAEERFGASVSQLYLTGGGARLKGFGDLLAHRLMVKVNPLPSSPEMTRILSAERADGARDYIAFSMARGLAKRLYNKSVNLRRGPHSYSGDSGVLRGLFIAVSIALIAIVALQGGRLHLERAAALAELKQLNEEVSDLGQRLFDDKDLELDTIKVKIETVKETKVLIPETSALSTLGELSRDIDSEINIEIDSIKINLNPGGRGQLNLRGKTQSIGDVSSIMDAVKKTTCFGAQAKQTNDQKSTDGRRVFTITSSSSCK